jgi:hypothetical protein
MAHALAHLTPGELFALAGAFLAGMAAGAAAVLGLLRSRRAAGTKDSLK